MTNEIHPEHLKYELATCKDELENKFKVLFDEHVQDELAKYSQIHSQLTALQQQLTSIQQLFEQGKGALVVLKWLGYLSISIWAFIVWAKDHIRI